MKISEYRLGFLGFGHMAQVLFQAIDRARLIPHSQICFVRRDTHKMKECEQKYKITATTIETLCEKSDVVLLGVRPTQVQGVLEAMQKYKTPKLLMTIVAGVPIAEYQKYLKGVPLLRVMPNLCSAVGEGMNVFTYSPEVSSELKSLSHLLFGATGQVLEVPESLMDISCGIAGSGPGFVFRLIDAMASAGIEQGMGKADALKMAAQTFIGAGKLILNGADPVVLQHQITVPNGTTEAGFHVMKAHKMDEHFRSVVLAAAKRSEEISRGE